MFSFTDSERTYLSDLRAITTDTAGREHLIGLDLAETAEYMEFVRGTRKASGGTADGERYIELDDKHEAARVAVIAAESTLRTSGAIKH